MPGSAAVLLQRLAVQLDPQPGSVRHAQVALGVGAEGLGDQLVEVDARRQVLDVAGHRNRGDQREIRGVSDRRTWYNPWD